MRKNRVRFWNRRPDNYHNGNASRRSRDSSKYLRWTRYGMCRNTERAVLLKRADVCMDVEILRNASACKKDDAEHY